MQVSDFAVGGGWHKIMIMAGIIGQILDALRSDHALLYACVRFAFPNRCWIYSIY